MYADVPVGLYLSIEHGNEEARELAHVDHAVQLREDVGKSKLPFEPHAQAGDDVAHEERGWEAVPARVPDRDGERRAVSRREVVEIAADLLGGEGAAGDVESGDGGRFFREEAHLDLGCLAHCAAEAALDEAGAERSAHGIEREIELLVHPPLGEEELDDEPRGPLTERENRARPDSSPPRARRGAPLPRSPPERCRLRAGTRGGAPDARRRSPREASELPVRPP